MDRNLTWMILGAISFLFAIVNLIQVIFFKKFSAGFLLCSLSCGALTVLEEYRIVGSWLKYENAAFLRSVPTITGTLSVDLWALIIVNALTFLIAKMRSLLSRA